MKVLTASLALLVLAGCASAPMTAQQRYDNAVRACKGSTVGAQSVALNTPEPMTNDDFTMRECLRSRGIHQ
jgi:hypothetical protein